MLLVWGESLVHNNSYCLLIVRQSHSCLHQAIMLWPWACQNHWAYEFDVVIPRQGTPPCTRPCLCISPSTLSKVSVLDSFVGRVCVCMELVGCASVHLCNLEGQWWIKGQQSVPSFVEMQHWTCGAQIPSTFLTARKIRSPCCLSQWVCRDGAFSVSLSRNEVYHRSKVTCSDT